jgi:hypothetical protein
MYMLALHCSFFRSAALSDTDREQFHIKTVHAAGAVRWQIRRDNRTFDAKKS